MGVHAFLDCPAPGCGYAVRFHAPDADDPPESLLNAWMALLSHEHPRHPRPLSGRAGESPSFGPSLRLAPE
jgi:hypothetical protein